MSEDIETRSGSAYPSTLPLFPVCLPPQLFDVNIKPHSVADLFDSNVLQRSLITFHKIFAIEIIH